MLYKDNISALEMYFFWQTFERRKISILCVDHEYLHSGVKLVSYSLPSNFICKYHSTPRCLKKESNIPSETFLGLF